MLELDVNENWDRVRSAWRGEGSGGHKCGPAESIDKGWRDREGECLSKPTLVLLSQDHSTGALKPHLL